MSFWRRSLMLAGALFLTACSHNSSLPPFTASGFAEDQGAVRIWRKDSGDNVHLLAVFSPWRSGDTTTREYRWQGDNLTLININVYSKPPVNIRARFDDRGDTADESTFDSLVDMNHNLYFNSRGAVQIQLTEKLLSLEEWKTCEKNRNRYDADSICADPLFVDAANHDYRLSEDSPARQMGIQSIDTERIGVLVDLNQRDQK